MTSINCFHYFLVTLFVTLVNQADAQTPEKDIRQVVDRLFEGMRSGDSIMVRSVFAAGSTLQSISPDKTGKSTIRSESTDAFVAAVGKPHEKKWDERIYDVRIMIDGPMAIAWAPYKFYLGPDFSHCGVNVFTFVKTDKDWKIAGITDTRRKENCP